MFAPDGKKSILAKKNYTNPQWICGNDLPGDASSLLPPREAIVTPRNNNCVIRVLALFTVKANTAVPDIENTIEMTIAQTNQAFRSSLIDECDAELVLVDVQQIPFGENPVDIVGDRENLIADMQDPMGDINARRDAADADIVLVFTDGNYAVQFGPFVFSINGIAGTLNLDPGRALAIIEADVATGQFTGAHETVHLLAGRHEPCMGNPDAGPSCDDIGPFEHAHTMDFEIYGFDFTRHTIMYGLAGRRVPVYSTPDVEAFGVPFGIAGARENARQITATACTVAAFEDDDDGPPLLNAHIAGSGFGCPCSGVDLSAQVIGGVIPYQYEWSTSPDGFNWAIQGASAGFVAALPCVAGEGVFVRLRVTSSDGQADEAFRFIEAATSWPGQSGECPEMLTEPGNGGAQEVAPEVFVFPNPTGDKIKMVFPTVEEPTRTTFGFYDRYGINHLDAKVEIRPENPELEINITGLSTGIYFVKVVLGDKTVTRKILKH
ncbi:MAG TPA: T9SS type A sorting domain-containing protein [Bacteroidetes bacterium]|nr:T9SS type A sorting domain-containing protein [Bacteroidota bacterium]